MSFRFSGRKIAYNKRKSPFSKVILILIVIITVIFVGFLVILSKLQPVIVRLADSSITDIVTLKVNDVIGEKISDGTLDYGNLVRLEKDSDGNITALVTDMAKINKLQTEITNEVINGLSNEAISEINIPLGAVTDIALFSGIGPDIPVKILSVSSVVSHFSNEFTSAGINQTCHKIMMDVDVVLDIIVPGYTTSATVTTQICVAETVIVGNVPSTYANLQ